MDRRTFVSSLAIIFGLQAALPHEGEPAIPELPFGFNRYTERARRALYAAQLEAHRLGSVELDTDHLLLTLAIIGGPTRGLFRGPGLSVDAIRSAMGHPGGFVRLDADSELHQVLLRPTDEHRMRLLEKGYLPASDLTIAFSAAVRDVLLGAKAEADRANSRAIGVEFLLLGMFHAKGSWGEVVLARAGLRLESTRSSILRR